MNDQEEIRALQKELEALQKQLFMQQEKIDQLQQRISQLTGEPALPVARKTAPRQPFSLENFIGLRLIHFIGIVVLVIGLSIGVKYAVDRNFISEGLRIALAYAAGILLYLLSVKLRKNYAGFSAILFSGAMASLYFTTYAAFSYYALFPFAIAFMLMVLLTVYSVIEAIRYNRQEIALLGLIGAYGIPFLISKNADRADLFFFYISVINIGAVFLSIKKIWRNTAIVAQVLTWILFIGWAAIRFNQTWQTVGSLFMAFFFLLFLFTAVSFRIFHQQPLRINDAYQIVLNNLALYIAALFVFGLSIKADADLSLITFVIAAVVGVQAFLLSAYWKEELVATRMLASSAMILFTLFIAFRWDGFTVTLLWLLISVIVFAYGVFIRSVSARLAAMILIGVTLGKLLAFDSITFSAVQKVIAYVVLGILLLVVSFFYQKFKNQLFKSDKD